MTDGPDESVISNLARAIALKYQELCGGEPLNLVATLCAKAALAALKPGNYLGNGNRIIADASEWRMSLRETERQASEEMNERCLDAFPSPPTGEESSAWGRGYLEARREYRAAIRALKEN